MTTNPPAAAKVQSALRLEKRACRRFGAAETLQLLTEADARPYAGQGARLCGNDGHDAQLSGWRKQHAGKRHPVH